MKKVNLKSKLALNKEVVTRLNNDQMDIVKGGAAPTGSFIKCCNPPETQWASCPC